MKDLLDKGQVERRMREKQSVVVVNEKEACVVFPTLDGVADMREMFYSNNPLFHQGA